MLPGGLRLLYHVGRDRLGADGFPVGTIKEEGLFAQEIDDALELVFTADGELHQNGVTIELAAELLDDLFGVAARAVHFVDEGNSRHAIAPHLAVDGERLGLHPAHGAKDEDRPVKDAEAALDLDRKIDVAGRIDEVDVVAVPLDRGSSTGDGDSALALQLHVVHGRAFPATLDLLDGVDAAGIEEDPLAESGLTRVDVGGNPNVAKFRKFHVYRRSISCDNSHISRRSTTRDNSHVFGRSISCDNSPI